MGLLPVAGVEFGIMYFFGLSTDEVPLDSVLCNQQIVHDAQTKKRTRS